MSQFGASMKLVVLVVLVVLGVLVVLPVYEGHTFIPIESPLPITDPRTLDDLCASLRTTEEERNELEAHLYVMRLRGRLAKQLFDGGVR